MSSSLVYFLAVVKFLPLCSDICYPALSTIGASFVHQTAQTYKKVLKFSLSSGINEPFVLLDNFISC